MSGGLTGGKGKLYYDATGADTPTWVFAYGVKLVSQADSWENPKHKDRDDDFVSVSKGFRTIEISGTINYKPANANFIVTFDVFKTAYEAQNDIGIFASDLDALSGSNTCRGVQADFKITEFGRNEPLEDGMEVPFKMELSADSSFAAGIKEITGAA